MLLASSVAEQAAVAKVLGGIEPRTRFVRRGGRIEADDAGQLARVRDIVLVLKPGQIWREIRLAGVTRTDFAASQGQFEAGLQLGTELRVPLWLARLKLALDLRYFPATDADTQEDLGLILEGSAALQVPFTRDLSVSLSADLYLYRPKIAQSHSIIDPTQTVERGTAVSLILGAGVTFDHLWKL